MTDKPELPDWNIENNTRLIRKVEKKDFMEVIELINKIARVAEDLDHHPNLRIHSWNKLDIEIYTHSDNSLTDKDFNLAKKIDTIISQ